MMIDDDFPVGAGRSSQSRFEPRQLSGWIVLVLSKRFRIDEDKVKRCRTYHRCRWRRTTAKGSTNVDPSVRSRAGTVLYRRRVRGRGFRGLRIMYHSPSTMFV